MNREEIKKMLPHREPMLLVDSMEWGEDGVVHGKYQIKGDEFFLKGHYPGHPVVPGVILCEIMGQSGSLLVQEHLKGRTPFFTGIDKTRFKNPVYPGDTIEVTAHIINQRSMLFFIDAKACVNGKVCAEATLSFALLDNKKVNEQ